MRRHLRFARFLLVGLAAAGCEGAGSPDLSVSADALTGVRGTLTLEAAKIPAREAFKVTVADADANLDPASLDAVPVYVSVTHAGVTSPRDPALLLETGASTGVFSSGVPVPSGVANGDTVTVTYRDPNAGSCAPATVIASAVVDAYSADLSVLPETIVADSTVVVGTEFHVRGTVRNDPRGGAAVPSEIRARLTRPGWDSEGYDMVEVYELGTLRTGTLAPGETVEFAFAHEVPLNINTNPLTLEVYADYAGEVPELSETNNVYKQTLGVVGADLTVDPGLTLDPPTTVISGHPLQVSGTVRNLGGATAVASTVSVRMYRPAYDSEGYEIEESYTIGQAAIPSLPPAGTAPFTVSFSVPEGLNGAFSVQAYADAGGVVIEGNETNNGTPAAQQPIITVKGSDLTVDAQALQAPASVIAGEVLQVSGIVRNASDGAKAAHESTVYVWIHRPSHDAEGYDIEESYEIGRATIPALLPGELAEFTVSGAVGQNLSGPFTLEVMADLGNVVAEYNESNNRVQRTVTVKGADLTVEPVSVPAEAFAGSLYQLQVKVVNATTGETARESAVGATLSRETCCDSEGYEYDETYVIDPVAVPALAPGASAVVSLSKTIPTTATRAPFALSVRADWQGVVQEQIESNNTWSTQVTVR